MHNNLITCISYDNSCNYYFDDNQMFHLMIDIISLDSQIVTLHLSIKTKKAFLAEKHFMFSLNSCNKIFPMVIDIISTDSQIVTLHSSVSTNE